MTSTPSRSWCASRSRCASCHACELERSAQTGRDALERGGDLDRIDPRLRHVCAVEPGRQLPHRRLAARSDTGNDLGHGRADIGGRGLRAREHGAEVAGGAADVDTIEHGSGSSYRSALSDRPDLAYGTLPAMNTSSDLAVLSSITAQVDELSRRITALAESYGQTPDSAVASELFATERAFATARRSLDRASTLLSRME